MTSNLFTGEREREREREIQITLLVWNVLYKQTSSHHSMKLQGTIWN